MRGKGNKKIGPVIRKEELVEESHHGGAWKVAYADFVTAMMAFFLLMWLLNATTEEQRKGLADYFTPANLLSHASSGTGQPFGGHTAFDDGAMVSDLGAVQVVLGKHPPDPQPDTEDAPTETDKPGPASGESAHSHDGAPSGEGALTGGAPHTTADQGGARPEQNEFAGTPPSQSPTATSTAAGAAAKEAQPSNADSRTEQERREQAAFEAAAQQIREAVRNDPALADVARQLAIDLTPEGLRIQMLDEERQSMFATGVAVPNERARMLLQKITPVLLRLPEDLSISGHTDAAPYPGPGRTNWDLSTERANATRRLLVESGLPENRIRTVTGHADRDPLLPADPLAAANRRIAIVVLRQAPATAH
ncbi:MAG: OmpA family protein [Acetobacteraceae bacterium]|nr:OmpA family protein [Acetobacteraceae bacterium]